MKIPGYYVVRKLGAGGFGRVFEALWLKHSTTVAVKLLEKGDTDSLRRFVREAQLLSNEVNNPHVVDFRGSNFNHSPPYIVMEYCDGGTLRSWVGSGRGWRDVAAAMLHASLGISALHSVGGFHRDIKPDNLLLSTKSNGNLVVKVGDFGLARDPSATDSMTRHAAGTNGYIAPEVLGGSDFESSADVYSLGVTAIELLTGTKNPDLLEQTECSRSLRALLWRMTSSRPRERPTIDEIVAELRTILAPVAPKPVAPKPQRSPAKKKSTDDALAPWLLGLGGLLVGGLAIAAAANADTRGSRAYVDDEDYEDDLDSYDDDDWEE